MDIIQKTLPGVKKNILLRDYTTFKIGGRAKYFFVAKTKEDLILAVKVAKKNKLPFFILGGGSNLLVADKGFKGLVIKIQNSRFKIQNYKIRVEAGTMLTGLLNASLKAGLTGLEWAVGIPGTVGGAIYGNAGTPKESMKDIVKEVELFDVKTEKNKIFKNKDCKFDYRESIFKKNKKLVILSTILKLKKGNKKEIKNKTNNYLNHRKDTQPLNFPSAGSIFKNPRLRPAFTKVSAGKQGYGGQAKDFLVGKIGEENKFSSSVFTAAQLIEKCILKGKRIGNVKISEKHANFIVNLGQGKAKDVKKLIELAKKRVKNKFGIGLEEEICYLGFKN